MKFLGTGSALPKKVVSNDDLAQVMDTSDEWIRSRTGIGMRHIAVEETTTSMAVEAAEKALADAKISGCEIDLIIAGTISPDYIFPSLACEVQAAIGAKSATAFDLSAGCSGFLFALATADAYFRTGRYKHALVIGAETLSKMMNWADRSTCVLFGDGAGAAVVSAEGSQLLSMVQGSDGDVTGMALSNTFGADMATVKENGVRQYPEFRFGASPESLGGMKTSVNKTVYNDTVKDHAIVGDFFSAFKWGFSKEIPLEIINRYSRAFSRA